MDKADRAHFLQTSVPDSARGIVARAFAGKGKSTLRNAIKAKCLDCCCYDRAEVAGCLVVLCPLYEFRPYQQKSISSPTERTGEQGQATSGGAQA